MTHGLAGPAPAPPPLPPWHPPPPPRTNGLAIAALVVGIVGLALCWVPFVGLGLPVLALGLGAAGLGRARGTGPGRGPGLAGVVLGGLGLLVAVTATIVFVLIWPKVSPCLDSRLPADARTQCLRDHLGLPPAAPTAPAGGQQFSRS